MQPRNDESFCHHCDESWLLPEELTAVPLLRKPQLADPAASPCGQVAHGTTVGPPLAAGHPPLQIAATPRLHSSSHPPCKSLQALDNGQKA